MSTAEAYRGQRRSGSPGDHRCTPRAVWELALLAAELDAFDIDPASNSLSTVRAHLSLDGSSSTKDGLARPWAGNVWLNPPFSRMSRWSRKCALEVRRIRSLTFLGPGDTSTAWWRQMVGLCDAWTAWRERVHFGNSGPLFASVKGQPPGPVHLFYAGPNPDRWREVMEGEGHPTFAGWGGG